MGNNHPNNSSRMPTEFYNFYWNNSRKCVNKNKQTFKTTLLLTLLRSAAPTFSERLKWLGIIFADNLVLVKQLIKIISSNMDSPLLSKLPDNKLGTLHAGLCIEKNSMYTMHLKMLVLKTQTKEHINLFSHIYLFQSLNKHIYIVLLGTNYWFIENFLHRIRLHYLAYT
jgi:hypothetical protein